MCQSKYIYVKYPGVIGYVIQYHGKVAYTRFYLDGIAYTMSLEEDEYDIFDPEGDFSWRIDWYVAVVQFKRRNYEASILICYQICVSICVKHAFLKDLSPDLQ